MVAVFGPRRKGGQARKVCRREEVLEAEYRKGVKDSVKRRTWGGCFAVDVDVDGLKRRLAGSFGRWAVSGGAGARCKGG